MSEKSIEHVVEQIQSWAAEQEKEPLKALFVLTNMAERDCVEAAKTWEKNGKNSEDKVKLYGAEKYRDGLVAAWDLVSGDPWVAHPDALVPYAEED